LLLIATANQAGKRLAVVELAGVHAECKTNPLAVGARGWPIAEIVALIAW
jgi:hypothetical protein